MTNLILAIMGINLLLLAIYSITLTVRLRRLERVQETDEPPVRHRRAV